MTVAYSPASRETQPLWVETPLRESYTLSQAAGWGIGNYILRRLEELPPGADVPHIFCSSGGNAGLAAVHASRTLGVPCTVVVPKSTKQLMINKLKAAGAFEVVQYGDIIADADRYVREELIPRSDTSAIYAPPFNHPDIWSGNQTLLHEITAQLPDTEPADLIICSVGGGGLLNGIAQGLDALSVFPRTALLAVETFGAHSLAVALRAGALVALPTITSQATSLGVPAVTKETFAYAQRENVRSVVLSDAEAAMGCWRLADEERLMVELACGVNVALCFGGRLERALGRKIRPEERVVIVLCGGSNVSAEMLAGWRREYGYLGEPEQMDRLEESGSETLWSVREPRVRAQAPLVNEGRGDVVSLQAKM